MTTNTPPHLGRPVGASGEETRKRIIVATMRCVAEVGYSQSTIREIARMANVTSASLYNYFPNKAELMKATIAERGKIAMPRLRAAAEGPGDIVERIEAVLDECGHLIREYPDLAAFEWAIRAENVVIPNGPGGRGDVPTKVGPALANFREIIEGLVADGYQRGELRDPDLRGTTEVVYALIFGLTELAATLTVDEFQVVLSSSKVMVSGTLFGGGQPRSS